MTENEDAGPDIDAGDEYAQRRLTREQLRQAITDLATAQLLEHRADRSANPALAALLRERALARRRRAERLGSDVGRPRPRA